MSTGFAFKQSLHLYSVSNLRIFLVFQLRTFKVGFSGPKCFRGFRETGPWAEMRGRGGGRGVERMKESLTLTDDVKPVRTIDCMNTNETKYNNISRTYSKVNSKSCATVIQGDPVLVKFTTAFLFLLLFCFVAYTSPFDFFPS